MNRIAETELILNADGSVYHLNLLPGDVADTVITVGDPYRVAQVSKHFDHIELKKTKREFVTHTGSIGGKRIVGPTIGDCRAARQFVRARAHGLEALG